MTDWTDPERIEPEDQAVAVDTADPDAPFGRDPRGKPYKLSPEARQKLSARLQAGRAASGSGRRRRSTRGRASVSAPRASTAKPSESGSAGPTMEQSLVGLVALPVALLNILGRRRPVLQLDAAAIAVHSAELIEATVFAAQTQPWLERWMGKVAVAGPWTPLMMTALSIGGQIAVNHGRMAPVPEFGIVSVADLQAKMEAAAQG